jgi:arylsulfatase A-like enzyme
MSLLDENKVIRNDFFYEHNLDIPTIPKSEALVSKQSKYIVYHELNPVYEEFYDLENDPKEKVNRIDDPAYKDEIKRAKTRFQELKECAK